VHCLWSHFRIAMGVEVRRPSIVVAFLLLLALPASAKLTLSYKGLMVEDGAGAPTAAPPGTLAALTATAGQPFSLSCTATAVNTRWTTDASTLPDQVKLIHERKFKQIGKLINLIVFIQKYFLSFYFHLNR